jgi:hypothetical protein
MVGMLLRLGVLVPCRCAFKKSLEPVRGREKRKKKVKVSWGILASNDKIDSRPYSSFNPLQTNSICVLSSSHHPVAFGF